MLRDLPRSWQATPRPRPPRRAPTLPARTAQQGHPHPRNRVKTEFHLHGCCLSSLLRPSLCWDSKHGSSHALFSGRGVSLPSVAELSTSNLSPSALGIELSVCNTQLQATGAGPEGFVVGAGAEVWRPGLGFGIVFRAFSISSSSLSCSFYPSSAGESRETTEGFATVLGSHPQNSRQHKQTLHFN